MTDQQEYQAFFTNRQTLLNGIKKAFQYLNKPFVETSLYRTTLCAFYLEMRYPNLSQYNQDYINLFNKLKAEASYAGLVETRVKHLNKQVDAEHQLAIGNITYEDWLANYESPLDLILKYGQYIALGIGFVLLMKTMKD